MTTTITTLIPGMVAPDGQLQARDGAEVQLASYWREQPALLFFVRNLGCVFCRQQLAYIRNRYAEVRARGAEVVTITPSDAGSADRFARSQRLPFPVLADLRRRSFVAYGLFEAPLGDILQPEVLLKTAQQWTHGNIPFINPFSSAFTQLGGLFVVDTAGIVRFSHVASPVFNYPPLDACLEAIDGARRA